MALRHIFDSATYAENNIIEMTNVTNGQVVTLTRDDVISLQLLWPYYAAKDAFTLDDDKRSMAERIKEFMSGLENRREENLPVDSEFIVRQSQALAVASAVLEIFKPLR